MLLHLWKNYKTTTFSAINLVAVFLFGKGYIDQATLELISWLTVIVGWVANVTMNKR
jgi:hypothetical protein